MSPSVYMCHVGAWLALVGAYSKRRIESQNELAWALPVPATTKNAPVGDQAMSRSQLSYTPLENLHRKSKPVLYQGANVAAVAPTVIIAIWWRFTPPTVPKLPMTISAVPAGLAKPR